MRKRSVMLNRGCRMLPNPCDAGTASRKSIASHNPASVITGEINTGDSVWSEDQPDAGVEAMGHTTCG